MLLIAGLGNPGSKYEKNRHNVGFMAVDEIHRHARFSPWKSRFKAQVSEGTLGGHKVLLVKPSTFMNESGRAVGEAARFYKIATSETIVLYDELDLAPGKVRIKIGGGAGGHNGIRSIDAHLGKDYKRVRIGIGHPGHKDRVHGHVLGDFSKSDQDWLSPLLQTLAENADILVEGNDSGFMNKIALAMGEKPIPEKQAKTRTPAKGQSHIRQARKPALQTKPPASGPMADMLKKLLGKNDTNGENDG